MNWKYYIPHEWTEDRTSWEDVYLLPDEASHQRGSFCLTVDAVGAQDNDSLSHEENAAARSKLQDAAYHIDGESMLVRGEAFSIEELLGWARLWLQEHGFVVGELVEAPREDFAGANWHIRALEQAAERGRNREQS